MKYNIKSLKETLENGTTLSDEICVQSSDNIGINWLIFEEV